MRGPHIWLLGVLLAASTTMSLALAQSRPANTRPNTAPPARPNTPPPARPKQPGMTAEREAAVLTFVRNYHPELADLLTPLKTTSRRDYERAIVELFRTSERLAQIEEKHPERHALELELWKAQSRVQLLAARLTMNDGAELRQRLREALERQLEVRKQLLVLERDRLRQRLEKLDDQILSLQEDQPRLVEQQIKALTRQTGMPAAAKDPKKGELKKGDPKKQRDKPAAPNGKASPPGDQQST
jgi:hypothetical protein